MEEVKNNLSKIYYETLSFRWVIVVVVAARRSFQKLISNFVNDKCWVAYHPSPLVTPCHGILTQSKCFHADQRVEENPPFSNSIHPSLPFTCVITKLIYFPAQEPLAGIIKDVNETKLITKKRWNKLPSPLYFCQFICSAFLYPNPLLVRDTDIHLLQAPDRWSIINVLKTRNRISFASQVMQIAAACYYFIHPFSQVVSLSLSLGFLVEVQRESVCGLWRGFVWLCTLSHSFMQNYDGEFKLRVASCSLAICGPLSVMPMEFHPAIHPIQSAECDRSCEMEQK